MTRIDGPFPITVRPTADGAELDVSTFVIRAVLTELFSQAYEDPETFTEEFAGMYELLRSAQHQGRDSRARHEFDARMAEYLKQFGDGSIPLYGPAVGQMRDELASIAGPRPLPAQERRRTA